MPVPDLKVLFIDDSPMDARRVQAQVSPDTGFVFTLVPRLQEGLRRLVSEEFDWIVHVSAVIIACLCRCRTSALLVSSASMHSRLLPDTS